MYIQYFLNKACFCQKTKACVWAISKYHTLNYLEMYNTKKMLKRAAAVSALMLLCTGVYAQDAEMNQRSTADIRKEASTLIADRNYIGARPLLKELIVRFENLEDKALKAQMETFEFYMAYSYVQEFANNQSNKNALITATNLLNNFIEKYPESKHAVDTLRTLASCYAGQDKLEQSAAVLEKLVNPPYVERLNASEYLSIVKQISETMYFKSDWANGQKWFERLFARANTLDLKVYAAVALMRSAISKNDFDAVMKLMPFMVYDAPARYDIFLNMDFLKAGDELVKRKEFSKASLMFSMVYSKSQILAGLKAYKAKMDREMKRLSGGSGDNPRLDELKTLSTVNDTFIKNIEDMPDYASSLMARTAQNYLLTKRTYESYWSFRRLIDEFPQDPNLESFYYAAFVGASQIGKDNEMFDLGQEYLKKFPGGNYVRDVVLNIAQYYLRTKQKPLFFSTSLDFIAKNPEDEYNRIFVFLLGKTWLEDENYKELNSTFSGFIKKYPDTPQIEGCYYWMGLSDLVQSNYKGAFARFSYLVENYPNGEYIEDACYRKGISAFGIEEYDKADEAFTYFMDRFPDSKLMGEAEFFLGDIAGLVGDLDGAVKHYMNVEKKTDNQSFINSAYLQSAKLYSAAERFEDQIKVLDSFIEKFPKEDLGMYIYQKGEALIKLGRPADALNLFASSIEQHGDRVSDDGIDKMILAYSDFYDKGKKQIDATVSFLEKAISDNAFREMLVKVPGKRYRYFEDNPNVDKNIYKSLKKNPAYSDPLLTDTTVLKNLLASYKSQQASFPKSNPEKFLKDMMGKAQAAKNQALVYRCMMGLDAMGKGVSQNKVFGAEDFKLASVRTLVWMAKEMRKYGPDNAKKAYEAALKREEYEYMCNALMDYANFLESQAQWQKAYEIYQQVERDYPADDRAGLAALNQAQMLLKLKKRAAAAKRYETVLKTPSWRGDTHAQALYELGQMAQEDGKMDDALMWYDRCFLTFSNCYKFSGKALSAAARLLVTGGKIDEAKKICDEFLKDEKNKACAEYEEIRRFRASL